MKNSGKSLKSGLTSPNLSNIEEILSLNLAEERKVFMNHVNELNPTESILKKDFLNQSNSSKIEKINYLEPENKEESIKESIFLSKVSNDELFEENHSSVEYKVFDNHEQKYFRPSVTSENEKNSIVPHSKQSIISNIEKNQIVPFSENSIISEIEKNSVVPYSEISVISDKNSLVPYLEQIVSDNEKHSIDPFSNKSDSKKHSIAYYSDDSVTSENKKYSVADHSESEKYLIAPLVVKSTVAEKIKALKAKFNLVQNSEFSIDLVEDDTIKSYTSISKYLNNDKLVYDSSSSFELNENSHNKDVIEELDKSSSSEYDFIAVKGPKNKKKLKTDD